MRQSVPRTVLKSLMSSLVLSRLDYHNATLSGISGQLVQRLQSVMNASHISPFLRQLHWLKARERIDYKIAVIVYKCLHKTGPTYLTDEHGHESSIMRAVVRCHHLI